MCHVGYLPKNYQMKTNTLIITTYFHNFLSAVDIFTKLVLRLQQKVNFSSLNIQKFKKKYTFIQDSL